MPPSDRYEFEAFNIPVMRLKDRSEKRYLVYKNASEYVEIEANTAQEAIDASGVQRPHKVVHVVKDLKGVLDQSVLQKVEQEAPEASNITPDTVPSTEDTPQ